MNKKKYSLLLALCVLFFLISSCAPVQFDQNAKEKDFMLVLKATGTNKEMYTLELENLLNKNISSYAKADISLILARITNNSSLLRQAISFYELALKETTNIEERILIYETLASLGYHQKRNLLKAAELWETLGIFFRADIDRKLAFEKPIEFTFETEGVPVYGIKPPQNFSFFIIGNSSITLGKNDVVVSQVDRVTRDWLGHQLEKYPFDTAELLRTFSERLTYKKEDLREDIGWHEGARLTEIRSIGLSHKVAVGTLVKKEGDMWYAPNEKGVFMFEVPIDKVLYPTSRFFREDLGLIVDTHGINVLVEQAIRLNATVVISDCDNPGKVKAAIYLSEKGIKVACTVDKYLPLAFGYQKTIVGSFPITLADEQVVLGNQPLLIQKSEHIAVEDVNSIKFSISYYQTPAIYFHEFEKYVPLNLTYVAIDDFNQMEKVLERADHVVAARVFNRDDYTKLKEWLMKNPKNRAILFHSSSYPYGYLILKEFPNQTTFDDIFPIFI